ncbi:MAG: cbb3-type cytochrome oxidase assembly protein CcoS [Candidatus Sericytochromatia bacterium]|uniref:Cbb3-type cytochrome oxidase assembly protein CcoS n=1 Tax=Candidatus Tanganyikabacteria bacterium TaxID=2961651 RepID=A0A937X4K9_9BACT|nr:cbb3-type cytochrome oxidase assembly protein CcoS [Candidatus Tanganyikabacteria bacterium]
MSLLILILPTTAFLAALLLWFLAWTLKSGQYDDLEGAAGRILFED